MSVISATILLLLVLDPLGNVPLFVCALKDVSPTRRRAIVVRELCIALAVLAVFLFAGRYILLLLHVSQSSLGIAGGIVLMLIALGMIFPGSQRSLANSADGEPFIVPLAIPLVAGPSALTTVLLLMARDPSRWLDWAVALIVAWAISGLVLLGAGRLARVLGERGTSALERLMGMLLTTVAVEMFITGLREAFP